MALLAAKTELVLMGDVDLLAGGGLRNAVSDARRCYWRSYSNRALQMAVHMQHALMADVDSASLPLKQAGMLCFCAASHYPHAGLCCRTRIWQLSEWQHVHCEVCNMVLCRYNELLRLTAYRMMVIVPTVLPLDVDLAQSAASGLYLTSNFC